MTNLMDCTPLQYYTGDQTKKNEMDGACDTYGEKEKCVQFWYET